MIQIISRESPKGPILLVDGVRYDDEHIYIDFDSNDKVNVTVFGGEAADKVMLQRVDELPEDLRSIEVYKYYNLIPNEKQIQQNVTLYTSENGKLQLAL